MKVNLVHEDNGLLIVFDEEFVDRFGLSADTVFEVSVANQSIILKPVDSALRFDGLMFERVVGNELVARFVYANGPFACERLPPLDDHVAIKRIEFHQERLASGLLAGDQR
jgi:hypothetical protein